MTDAMKQAEPVAYVVRSMRDGSIRDEIAPTRWMTFESKMEKFRADPWVQKGIAEIVPLYANPTVKLESRDEATAEGKAMTRKMTLVERLRIAAKHGTDPSPFDTVCYEAADEIDRLTAEVERLKTVPMKYRRMEFNAQLQNENKALAAEVESLKTLLLMTLPALEESRRRYPRHPNDDSIDVLALVSAALKGTT